MRVDPDHLEDLCKYFGKDRVKVVEKQIEKVFRKVARQTAQNGEMPYKGVSLKPQDIAHLLGNPIYNRDKYQGNE